MNDDALHRAYLAVRAAILDRFERDELRDLCLELGINPAWFSERRLSETVDDLLAWADENGRRADLIALLRAARPAVDWPDDYAVPLGPAERPFIPAPPPDPAGPVPMPGPLPPGSRLLLPPNPLFTGREAELQVLAASLLPVTSDERRVTNDELRVTRHSTPVTLLSGIGGVGKTQLAVEFAHRYGRFFHGVYWVSMANPAGVGGEIAACGLAMGLSASFSALPLPDQIAWVRRVWAGPEARLIVFDNCEDPALLAEWRPPAGGARLLVTSRAGEWPAEAGVTVRRVSSLSRAQSLALLRAYLESVGREETDAALGRVAAEVGDLPLALGLAGHFLARYRETSLDGYLAELAAAIDLVPVGRNAVSATGHELSVWRTFTVSLERLRDDDPIDRLARALLARAACFAPGEPLPEWLLRAAAVDADGNPLAPARDLTDALYVLVEVGLLERLEESAVRLHRLVATFTTRTLAGELAAVRRAVETATILAASAQNQSGDPRRVRSWISHVRYVTDTAFARTDRASALLCDSLGTHLWSAGDPAGAERYLRRTLTIDEQVFGPDSVETANTLNSLGGLLQERGQLTQAKGYLERAYALRLRRHGMEHADTAQSINNLGLLLHRQGRLSEARFYYMRALAVRARILPDDDPALADSQNNLGSLLTDMGKLSEAKLLLTQALAARERAYGTEHRATAQSLNNLGFLYKLEGDYAAAESCYRRALEVWQRILGEEHPDVALARNNLGSLLFTIGDLDGAQAQFQKALAVRQRVLGRGHPETAMSLYQIGYLKQAQGDTTEARRLYKSALAILEDTLEPGHPNSLIVRASLETVL